MAERMEDIWLRPRLMAMPFSHMRSSFAWGRSGSSM